MPEPDDITRLRRIRDRRQHGLPPECMADVDFLLGLLRRAYEDLEAFYPRTFGGFTAAATLQPRRKRCKTCGGEQEVNGETCTDCEGSGYQESKA